MANDVRIQIEVDSKTGEARVKALGDGLENLGKKGKASAGTMTGAFDLVRASVMSVGTSLGVLSGVSVAGFAAMAGKAQTSAFQMQKAFGAGADAMIAKAKQLSESAGNYYGLEEVQYAFVKTGDSMARYGITGENYLNLVNRAMDVGAAKGLELKDSIDRIESAMRGEAEASEYLGVTLSDTYMKNMAFGGSLRDTWEKLSDNEKAMYRYQEFMKQSGKYTGSAAEASKTFDGALSSLANTIKTALTPALIDFAEAAAGTIQAIGRGASVRSVSGTMDQALMLAQRGALDWSAFTDADFATRQKMVDQALAYEDARYNFARRGRTAGPQADRSLAAVDYGAFFGRSTVDSALEKQFGGSMIAAQSEIQRMERDASQKAEQAAREAERRAEAARKLDLQHREQFWHEAGAQHTAALEIMTAQSELAAERELAVMEAKTGTIVQLHEDAFWDLTELSQRTADAMEQNFSDFFFDAITGKLTSLADFGAAVLNSLARASADVLGQMAKTALFGGTSSNGLLGSLIGSFLPGRMFVANGAAFGPSGLIPFASGGIVNRPTVFPFAGGTGLMGEAGPEAIMPLSRGADGKLGVAGGGGTTIVYAPNISAVDSRSVAELIVGQKNVIIGLITQAANSRSRYGPTGR